MTKLKLLDRCLGALLIGPASAAELAKRVGVTTHTAYGAISDLRLMGKVKHGEKAPRRGPTRPEQRWVVV